MADFAEKIATEVMGDWLKTLSDGRTVTEMIAEGVRRGYAMGLAVSG